VATRDAVHVASRFNENPKYFQMQTRRDIDTGVDIVCSETYPGEPSTRWRAVENGTIDTW
jgi:predicted glutamine amidotransferase